MGLTIIGNFPWGKGAPQKRIFNKACEKGKVYSLQPVGSWKTRVGNIAELLPLHTSKEEFGIAIMPLAIHTNANENVVEWDVSKVPTCADLPDGNEKLKMSAVNTGRGKAMNIPVNVRQPLQVNFQWHGDHFTSGIVVGQEPLKVNNVHTGYGHGGITSSICIKQPLKVGSNFQGANKLKNPVVIGDKQPLGVGHVSSGETITNTIHIKQPLNTGNYVDHRGIYSNGATVKQESKNVIYFNTKKERTNFIKNIGKVIPLQMLFFSGLFPTPKQRILPPLDREYSTEELLEYFNFPKDAYDEFNDMTQEEEYHVSYERWKTVRKEKYGLDWEEE